MFEVKFNWRLGGIFSLKTKLHKIYMIKCQEVNHVVLYRWPYLPRDAKQRENRLCCTEARCFTLIKYRNQPQRQLILINNHSL